MFTVYRFHRHIVKCQQMRMRMYPIMLCITQNTLSTQNCEAGWNWRLTIFQFLTTLYLALLHMFTVFCKLGHG